MIRALVLWLSLAAPAAAQDLTGRLVDALMTPGADGPALLAALKAQGFRAEGVALAGAEALPEGITDPAYFYLRADLSPEPGPLILLECSRIGPGLLPHLPRGASSEGPLELPVVPLLQWAETVAFLPGAAMQLRCRADLLPVAAQGGPVPLPPRAEVEAALAARFATVSTGPLDGETGPGRVAITAGTADPATPGAARDLRYEHRDDGTSHSLDLILHTGDPR